jgi:hypothetical protein
MARDMDWPSSRRPSRSRRLRSAGRSAARASRRRSLRTSSKVYGALARQPEMPEHNRRGSSAEASRIDTAQGARRARSAGTSRAAAPTCGATSDLYGSSSPR